MNTRNRIIIFLIAWLMPMAMLAQTNHWTPVSAPYEDNMSLTGVIQINGVEQQSTALEVGAFCGTECRGSARPVLFPVTGRYVFSLTIFGNDGDQITFKLYDHSQGTELDLQSPAAVTFGPNGLGSPLDPYVLNFTAVYTISASANPSAGGTVGGGGTYNYGSTCTLTATPATGYNFVRWTKNGTVVSTAASYSFTVTENSTFVANFTDATGTGVLNGVFSVGENSHVNFSYGNLQYLASTNTWRFATNQWDYVGYNNSNISSSYSGWIDLFGWGTSGYHDATDPYNVNYQPWSTSTSQVNSSYNKYGYGPSTNMTDPNLTGTSVNYDWGVYNPISNCGNQTNQWRTLTRPEWNYVLNTRATSSGIRYAKAQVNNVNGVILLPDNWSTSTYSLSDTNNGGASFSSNTLTASQWSTLEQAGAVFLPAAGYRYGTSVSFVGSEGGYWSASYCGSYGACGVFFYDSSLSMGDDSYRYRGRSVRLVRVAENYSYEINATPNPAEGGAVSGGGTYEEGTTCTLTATANAGYTFINWTENGEEVSTEATYSFTVTGDMTLVANFEEEINLSIPTEGLIAYYPFNGNANDESGNGNHGSLQGNVPQLTTDRFGNENSAYLFGGYYNQGWVYVPNSSSLQLDNAMSMSFWMNLSSYDGMDGWGSYSNNANFAIICKEGDRNGFNTCLNKHTDGRLNVHSWNNNGSYDINTYQDYTLDEWMHCVITIENNLSKIYINGVWQRDTIKNQVNFSNANNCNMYIGIMHAGGMWYPFNGKIDDVILYNRALTAQEVMQLYNKDNGCLPGVFSVSANTQVNFSQGNLQWSATGGGTDATSHAVADGGTAAGTWRFAEHQWDFVGNNSIGTVYANGQKCNNSNVSSTYSGWIDFFSWGTSGWSGGVSDYQPYATSWNYGAHYPGGDWNNDLTNDYAYADWGVYNAISNGGDSPNLWRTLAAAEWEYLVNTRTASTLNGVENARYAKATVNNIKGLILFPDNYSHPNTLVLPTAINVSENAVGWDDNNYTTDEWAQMETAGAVFLPASGWSDVTGCYDVGTNGVYQSTTHYSSTAASKFGCDAGGVLVYPDNLPGRRSVRLVKNVQLATCSIEATPNPIDGGTITGFGTYYFSEACTLTAMPNEGYTFINWTENGEVVSTEATYSFTVTGNRELVANFAEDSAIMIGDSGEATNQYLPSYSYYNYSLTQQIYTADEIGTDGFINSIAFFNGGAEKTRSYDVYMVHTDKNNFDSNTDWIAVTEADRVFSGTVTMTANTWTTFWFDTPFAYNGVSNLALIVDDNSGNWTGSPHMACRVFDANGNQAIRVYSDGTNYNPYNPSGYGGTLHSVKNQIKLGIIPYELTVHNGTATNEYVPVYGFYTDAYLKSEFIMPASELTQMAGFSINRMKFFASQTNVSWGNASFQVFMKEVDDTTINSYSGLEGATVVYEGSLNISDGVMDVVFAVPYQYNGGNLLIGIYNTVKGSWVRSNWYGETVDGSSVQGYSYNGLDAINPTQRNFLPKTTFYYQASDSYQQSIALAAGWNWFSTYLDITLDELKAALVETSPSTTISISSQNSGNTTYNGTMWRGNLNTLDVKQMYMIQTGAACEMTLTGLPINPAGLPITIHNGFNWIAFPLSENMSLTDAFAGFAVNGDIITSQFGYATYNGSMWRGSLSTLEPNKGYMYRSSVQGDRVFTFPISTK